jgi:hypothetical protein
VTPPQTTQQQVEQAPPAQNPADARNEADLQAARDLFVMLGTRANSVRASLRSLEQQQARSGLGLRADMATARQRLEYQMDEAENALKSNDGPRARKTLAAAERELEKLENFLGQ